MAGELIAVIDNDPIFLAFMAELLADEAYQPVPWRSSETAMEMIRREKPVVIVLDSWLERRESGSMLLRQLRQDLATKHIPVILCSTDARAVELEPRGVDGHLCIPLHKPFELADLLAAIRAALEHAKGGRAPTKRPIMRERLKTFAT